MNRFVPYEKRSKKEKKKADALARGTWGSISPVTRKPRSPRAYDRRKAQNWKKDSGSALLVFVQGFRG